MTKNVLLGLSLLSLVALACNLPLLGGLTSEQVATFAAGTVEAVNATQLAAATPVPPTETVPPPTDTPEPATETPVPPTPTAGVAGCTDLAGFVADVTIPDNTVLGAGSAFVKTWRLRNNGTCTWTSSYAMVFDSGDKMGGPDSVPLAGVVAPGATVDLSVNLTAPAGPGTYQGNWKLRNNAGVLFGLGGNSPFFVKIVVSPTPTPSPTGGIVLLPPLIPLLIYTSNGDDMTIGSGSCFDLDAGSTVSCGSPASDFRYDFSFIFPFGTEEKVTPQNGAQFRSHGGNPTSADCQALTLSGVSFDPSTTTYCYRTSNGKYGWMRVDLTGFTLQFDWGTYLFP